MLRALSRGARQYRRRPERSPCRVQVAPCAPTRFAADGATARDQNGRPASPAADPARPQSLRPASIPGRRPTSPGESDGARTCSRVHLQPAKSQTRSCSTAPASTDGAPSSAASDPGGGSRRWQRASDGPRQTNPAEDSNPMASLPHPTGSPPASVRHPALTVNREPRGPFEALSRVTDLDVAAMWTDAFTSPEAIWESFRKLRRRTTTAQGRWRTVLTGRTAYPALPIPTFRTVSRSIGRGASARLKRLGPRLVCQRCRGPRRLEGMTGIEPAPSVWKTEALPLSYIPVVRDRL